MISNSNQIFLAHCFPLFLCHLGLEIQMIITGIHITMTGIIQMGNQIHISMYYKPNQTIFFTPKIERQWLFSGPPAPLMDPKLKFVQFTAKAASDLLAIGQSPRSSWYEGKSRVIQKWNLFRGRQIVGKLTKVCFQNFARFARLSFVCLMIASVFYQVQQLSADITSNSTQQ